MEETTGLHQGELIEPRRVALTFLLWAVEFVLAVAALVLVPFWLKLLVGIAVAPLATWIGLRVLFGPGAARRFLRRLWSVLTASTT